MSLDSDTSRLVEFGKVEVTVDGIIVTGFRGKNCGCRDVAVQACLWAIGELQREALRAIEQPGNNNIGIGGP
jgi:hypothetical protein